MNFQLTSSNDWNEYLADWCKIEINPGWDTLDGVFQLYSFTIWMQKWRYAWFWGDVVISLILKKEQIWFSDKARIIPSFLILTL